MPKRPNPKLMTVIVDADTEEISRLIDLVWFVRKRTKSSLNIRCEPKKLIRESCTHRPGKTTVHIHPNKRLLNAVARYLARQFNLPLGSTK